MSWAKLDDQYTDHPKIVQVGPLGMALHVAMICYCARYLTDGFVPSAMIPRLISLDSLFIISNAVSNAVTHKQLTDELTAVGLLEIREGGYFVHDYLKYNPTGAEVKREREATKERQRKFREDKRKKNGQFGGNTNGNGVTNAQSNTTPSPYPYPVKEDIYSSVLSDEFTRLTNIPAYDLENWTNADQDMTRAGVTVDELPITLQKMQLEGWQYSGLPSIVKTAIWVHAQRSKNQPIFSDKKSSGSRQHEPERKEYTGPNGEKIIL